MIDVSVILITYNQEKFVSQSFLSILSQRFTGEVEILISDDFSTDNTFNILNELSKGKSNVRLLRNNENLGLSKNFAKVMNLAKGKYIAYLEGDDYWTDPYKLQKQFDFLESRPMYVLAFHDFVTVDKDDIIISDSNLMNTALMRNRSKKDMIIGCLIHQNTMMFRNVIEDFPLGFFKAKNHDTFLIAYLSKWGEAGYVKCDPLHYRIQENSLWSSLSVGKKNENALITYLWIFSIASFKTYMALAKKVLSKIKSIILMKLN